MTSEECKFELSCESIRHNLAVIRIASGCFPDSFINTGGSVGSATTIPVHLEPKRVAFEAFPDGVVVQWDNENNGGVGVYTSSFQVLRGENLACNYTLAEYTDLGDKTEPDRIFAAKGIEDITNLCIPEAPFVFAGLRRARRRIGNIRSQQCIGTAMMVVDGLKVVY